MPNYFDTLEVSGDKFDWKKGIGYADASDVGLSAGRMPNYTLAVTSHKTGAREYFFYLSRYVLGEDAVEYRYRSATGWMVVLFDD